MNKCMLQHITQSAGDIDGHSQNNALMDQRLPISRILFEVTFQIALQWKKNTLNWSTNTRIQRTRDGWALEHLSSGEFSLTFEHASKINKKGTFSKHLPTNFNTLGWLRSRYGLASRRKNACSAAVASSCNILTNTLCILLLFATIPLASLSTTYHKVIISIRPVRHFGRQNSSTAHLSKPSLTAFPQIVELLSRKIFVVWKVEAKNKKCAKIKYSIINSPDSIRQTYPSLPWRTTSRRAAPYEWLKFQMIFHTANRYTSIRKHTTNPGTDCDQTSNRWQRVANQNNINSYVPSQSPVTPNPSAFPSKYANLGLRSPCGKTLGKGSKVTTDSGCLHVANADVDGEPANDENIEYLEGCAVTAISCSGFTKSNPTLFTFDSETLFRNSCEKKNNVANQYGRIRDAWISLYVYWGRRSEKTQMMRDLINIIYFNDYQQTHKQLCALV